MRLIKFGFIFFIPLLFSTSAVLAQDEQTTYLKAKEYFQAGEYTFAMEYFRQLSTGSSSHPFKEYASFYYGLSAYKFGDLNKAKSMWLQITMKNKGWKNISEVNYWLSEVYFQEKDYSNGVLYAKKSGIDASIDLMRIKLTEVEDVDALEKLFYQFPNDEIVAEALASRIAALPLSSRNTELLDTVVDKFELDASELGLHTLGESKMKKSYKVAVLLPFMFDGLSDPRRTVRNKFIMDIYHGMEEAVEMLNQKGTKIQLFAYDTRRDSIVTAALLSLPEMKSMDLLVGPLFPVPSQLVADFSYNNKINMINPLSNSSEVIGNNPYSFLFGSTVETQALVAAELASEKVKNKNVMVFYEDNKKDSVSAYTYAQKIMENGFEVLFLEKVRDTTVRASYDLLTKKFEVRYSKEKADTIRSRYPHRIIKEKKSIREKDVMVYYEELFTIAPDSIGHIYVASSKTLFASNYISAVEIRADSTQIIGRAEWQNTETLTFEEMERLGVYFIDPWYVDDTKDSYQSFRKKYIKKYNDIPSQNAMIGYDMTMTLGKMMIKNGHYFQSESKEPQFMPGEIFGGVLFDGYNSNQYVPITRFEDSQLKVINSAKDGERKE